MRLPPTPSFCRTQLTGVGSPSLIKKGLDAFTLSMLLITFQAFSGEAFTTSVLTTGSVRRVLLDCCSALFAAAEHKQANNNTSTLMTDGLRAVRIGASL